MPSNMRISEPQARLIAEQVHRHLGESARIWLFGSRLEDNKRGGDVDLYVEAEARPVLDAVRCKIALEDGLDLPVDLIVRPPLDDSPIARIARGRGRAL
jgi:predicted nucleotidyltransferase